MNPEAAAHLGLGISDSPVVADYYLVTNFLFLSLVIHLRGKHGLYRVSALFHSFFV